jgi:hypothetical protein
MMNITLPQLQSAMDTKIVELGGIEAAIKACDRMYSATFRGDAVKLSYFRDGEDEKHSLYLELATTLYAKATEQQAPQREDIDCGCHHDCDCESDSFMYASEAFDEAAERWMVKNYPDFIVNDDTLVVDFCNYKGEGEDGLGLYELHKHLPVFISKSHSFNQVN